MSKKLLITFSLLFAVVVGLCALSYKPLAEVISRPIIGRVEYVGVDAANMKLKLKARIDTGAGISSIDAKILEIKKPENPADPERVVFQLTDDTGKTKTLERKIIKWVNIKRKGSEGYIRRPTVKMDICLGGVRVESRVNLADRSGFLYPLLIGRNTLKAGDYLIDPEQAFMQRPGCI